MSRNNPGLGAPGGSNQQIQFNDNGYFGGVPGLSYDPASGILSGGGILAPISALSNIATLARWYDAQSLPVVADSTALGTWTDRMGNDNLTQATGANQPLYRTSAGAGTFNGYPCVNFTAASTQWMATAGNLSSGPRTIIAIARHGIVTANVLFASGTVTTGGQLTVYPNNPDWIMDGGGAPNLDSGIAAIANEISIVAVTTDGAGVNGNTQILVNGFMATGKPAITPAAGPLVVGAGLTHASPMTGDIGEIGVWQRKLYQWEIWQAMFYLARKWGLTAKAIS